jgi:hypothetical protein
MVEHSKHRPAVALRFDVLIRQPVKAYSLSNHDLERTTLGQHPVCDYWQDADHLIVRLEKVQIRFDKEVMDFIDPISGQRFHEIPKHLVKGRGL